MANIFGVFYLGTSYEANRLVEEATGKGLTVWGIDRREIMGRVADKGEYFWQGNNLSEISWAVVRPSKFGDDTEQVKIQMPTLMQWLKVNKTILLDSETAGEQFVYNKWNQLVLLAYRHVPVVETEVFGQSNLIPSDYFERERVIKRVDGAVGNAVWKVATRDEALTLIDREKVGNLIFELYYPGNTDYRVLVLGSECLGVMRRTAKEGDFRSNYSLGGLIEKVDLTEEMRDVAVRATRAMKLDFAGVDLFPVEGRLKVLEVNRSAQFKGFEQATGINVAKKIVEYLLKK